MGAAKIEPPIPCAPTLSSTFRHKQKVRGSKSWPRLPEGPFRARRATRPCPWTRVSHFAAGWCGVGLSAGARAGGAPIAHLFEDGDDGGVVGSDRAVRRRRAEGVPGMAAAARLPTNLRPTQPEEVFLVDFWVPLRIT